MKAFQRNRFEYICVNVLLPGAGGETVGVRREAQRWELKRARPRGGAGPPALITEQTGCYGFLMYSSHMPLSSCFTDSIVKPLFSQ